MVEITSDERAALRDALAQLVGHAWTDESFKAQLIAEPGTASAKLGVGLPQSVRVEFYDDPAASVGDWSTAGDGVDQILRVPIPARPSLEAASTTELAGVGGGTMNGQDLSQTNNDNNQSGSRGGGVDLSPDDIAAIIPAILAACCSCGAASQDVDVWY